MRIKDWGYTVAVLGVCFLLMCGCDSRSDEGLSLSNGPDAVYLDINVALRDASASGRSVSGRAEEEMYGEVTEAEKMHTLRVILVRPDGRVEHNVYLDLKNASVSDRYGKIRLKVQGNEEKTIYLLGNEGSASVELPAVEVRCLGYPKLGATLNPETNFLPRSRWQGLCCRLTMWGLSIKLTRYL